ncbi:LacI family transcriptional regulator [Paenibacillus lycopersici]|uniref:LacI family transcriptional regulator n=1 Tax=Paenibacillus lycopersici TaxID=2704462 RepID=A0A6C0FXV8_9BACL|nr:LacI family DNA-binding transcriptional regulator [Paenibacillus lycopersici]QHT59799.1 LacI family transcriptional regulator [Paenibacillus lycopersici]
MPTLKDIADRLGVSISTVSRAISNDANRPVSKETKRKVLEVANEIGYEIEEDEASSAAKAHYQIEKSIGCIMPQSLFDYHPYFSSILSGFRKRLYELGRTPAFFTAREELASPNYLRSLIRETGVKGILSIAWYDKEQFEVLKEEGVRVLGVSLNYDSLAVPVVDCDRLSAARSAVRHLIAQGHKKIGFIGGPSFSNEMDEDERFSGYKFGMLETGSELNKSWIINAKWDVDLSYSLMNEMLDRLNADERPTAMFCASDALALPALRAAVEKGYRIPQDIAFVGMDNIEFAQYSSPPLTSVQVPKSEIGEVAANMLVNYVEGHYSLPLKVLLPYELVVRQSSAFINKEG